ncbi:MAG: radical SAM family heme chaperone HemW [Pirellulaceae bacterium]
MGRIRSAYIHVPFCQHRCGYCNFSLVADRDELVPRFLDSLEIELASVLGSPQPVDTLYFGGGTPSHLEPAELDRLLRLTSEWLPLSPGGEWTCELNPSDAVDQKLQLLQQWGVNRVSLGGQSFSDSKLKVLERDHSSEQLHRSLDSCADYFENISLDMIFAAPGESLQQWEADIDEALGCNMLRHLSTYGLTVEKGSAFFGRVQRGQIRELDENLQADMYEILIDRLTAAGWEHYEISSFTQGNRSRHNEAYWSGEPWWAFGPGAASFLPATNQHTTEPHSDGRAASVFVRQVNHQSTTTYIRRLQQRRSPIAERLEIDLEQQLRERFVFGMRRLQGVDLNELSQHWPTDFRSMLEPKLTEYLDRGWFEFSSHGTIRLTRKGLMISDGLWPAFL